MTRSQNKPEVIREEMVRQLEQLPTEVLEAALVILQLRQTESKP